MGESIVRLDLHGKNQFQAKMAIDAALRRSSGIMRLRLVHGYTRGTALRDMIWEQYASRPPVKRLVRIDDGTTDLVLREY